MKRFSEMAEEVVRGRVSAPPSDHQSSMRHPHACAAAGCPLAGSISDSTTGGGPWECRFHKFREPPMTADDVTIRINNRLAAGLPLDERRGPSMGSLELGKLVRRPSDRVPGGDDDRPY